MKEYNKLIRDNIPSIIGKNNQTCKVRELNDAEYLTELNKKLSEEIKEYLESGEVEELADIEEVLRAILACKGYSPAEFEKIRQAKADKNGAFNKKLFLEWVEDNKQ